MKFLSTILILLWIPSLAIGQAFTSYITGDTSDVITTTTPGTVLMGGAGESDEAMQWFLQRAVGGDILVIRASGSDGYNNYLFSQLGIAVNSVETIVFNSAAAASDPYVLQQISSAEAIWIAGGDQYDYVQYWKNNAVEDLLNNHMNLLNRPIGGTSAGMAILGGNYFDASNGTVTSNDALIDPYDNRISLGSGDFLDCPYLSNVITDTHYDDPDRRGRHTAFLARLSQQHNARSFGIACDEYTAVCIDENGLARVFGDYPTYDDNAYFIQTNCIPPFLPETLSPGQALTWDRNNEAIKVYAVKGTNTGTPTFDLTDWKTGNGGNWENWFVINGQFFNASGIAPNCPLASMEEKFPTPTLYPNPGSGRFSLEESKGELVVCDLLGKEVWSGNGNGNVVDISNSPPGIYLVSFIDASGTPRQIKYLKAE